MRKSLLLLPFCLIALLWIIPSAFAVWDDSTGVIWVSEGETLSLGQHSLKVIDASADEGVPFIEIKRKGNILYKGFIETDKPVQVEHEIFVEYLGSTHKVNYGAQIKLRVYQWVDAKIVNARFPRYLNRETRYNVWLEVESTGAKDAVFNTQLTQEGAYNIRSGQYVLPDGTPTPIILDLAFPTQNVYIPGSTLVRVKYNDISGNRRQTSLLGDPQVRAGNSIEKNANVVFNLYFKGQILDSVTIPNVGYGKSPSGYIPDIEFPDVLVQNQEYEAKAFVTNGAPGGNTIDAGKINLQLLTKGFTLGDSSNKLKKSPELQISEDLLRKGLLTGETDDWRFTITPNVPAGEYDVTFRLWQNRHSYLYSTYDEFTKHVRVLANPNRIIDKVILPPSVTVGENIPIEVRLNNVGIGKLVNVNVRAPTLLDSPAKKVVTVPTDSTLSIFFTIPALVAGRAPVTVEVYPHKASNYKWNDPYAESGARIDSVTKNVEVLGLEEGESLPPLPLNELPPQPRIAGAGRAKCHSGLPSIVKAPALESQGGEAPEGLILPLPPEGQVQGQSPSQQEVVQTPYQPLSSQAQSVPSVEPYQPYPQFNLGSFGSESGMVALAILIILMVLLSLRVVINYHRRSRRLSAHEAVERHLRKKYK